MLNPRQNSTKLTHRAREMRKEPSDAEHRLWLGLRDRRLDGLKFRRQLPIGDYIADFACQECRLIVEVDGNQHAFAVEYDERRTAVLGAAGWRVLRIHAGDVLRNTDSVLRLILAEARKPSP
jgi:very-short-patch-repair endonuclease